MLLPCARGSIPLQLLPCARGTDPVNPGGLPRCRRRPTTSQVAAAEELVAAMSLGEGGRQVASAAPCDASDAFGEIVGTSKQPVLLRLLPQPWLLGTACLTMSCHLLRRHSHAVLLIHFRFSLSLLARQQNPDRLCAPVGIVLAPCSSGIFSRCPTPTPHPHHPIPRSPACLQARWSSWCLTAHPTRPSIVCTMSWEEGGVLAWQGCRGSGGGAARRRLNRYWHSEHNARCACRGEQGALRQLALPAAGPFQCTQPCRLFL